MATKRPQQSRAVPSITTADLLAGATLPMRVTLNVTLEPGLTDKIAGEDPACAHRGRPDIGSILEQYTPTLVKWASKSSDNAMLLLTNPLEALDRSRANVSAGDRAALEQHLRSVMPTEVLPGGVQLVAANVNVAKGRKP